MAALQVSISSVHNEYKMTVHGRTSLHCKQISQNMKQLGPYSEIDFFFFPQGHFASFTQGRLLNRRRLNRPFVWSCFMFKPDKRPMYYFQNKML